MRDKQSNTDGRVREDMRKRTIENSTLIEELSNLRF